MGFDIVDYIGVDLRHGAAFLATMKFLACMACIAIVLVETVQEPVELSRKIVFPIIFLYIALCVFRQHSYDMFLRKTSSYYNSDDRDDSY